MELLGGDVTSIVASIISLGIKGSTIGGRYAVRRLLQELSRNTTDLLETHRRQDLYYPLGVHKFIFSTNRRSIYAF